MSLYKKHRPQTLAEMKGNAALISQIKAHTEREGLKETRLNSCKFVFAA